MSPKLSPTLKNHLKLAYVVHKAENVGNSPKNTPILVLHGLLGSKKNWTSTCKKLSSNLNVKRDLVALDLRNHGESPHSNQHDYKVLTEDVKGFVGDLESGNVNLEGGKDDQTKKIIDRVSFIGHSMGGKVAMRFALLYPEKVHHLIICDIAPIKYRQIKVIDHIVNAVDEINLPKSVDSGTARLMVEKQLQMKIKAKETRDFVLMNLVSNPDGSYKWKCNLKVLKENVGAILDFPEVKGTFEKPVLFVAGTESDLISKEDEPKIKSYFPNYELIYIEGSNHNVHTEKQSEFIEICTKYLDEK